MANHCIDCGLCGEDLRAGHRCNWRGCPGWISGKPDDLAKVAEGHPDQTIALTAVQNLAADAKYMAAEAKRWQARAYAAELELDALRSILDRLNNHD